MTLRQPTPVRRRGPTTMSSIRRRMRGLVLASLIFHVTSFSMLVPQHCSVVAALTLSTVIDAPRHEHAESECPMRAADGSVCPMHRGHSDRHGSISKDDNDCSMASRSTLGPLTIALYQGILPVVTTLSADGGYIAAVPTESVSVRSLLIPPDSPPPRG